MKRFLTITIEHDWQAALRSAGQLSQSSAYQGETLNFENPEQFFGRLSDKRWALIRLLQGKGELGVRELARQLGRDVKRVHEDVATLTELGLLERTQAGGVVCPFEDVHVDMHLQAA